MVSKAAMIALIISLMWFAVPICASADVEWQTSWYDMDEPGQFNFDKMLALTTSPFHFAMDWGSGTILDTTQLFKSSPWASRDDKVGFQATCSFFISEANEYSIVVRANNGIILQVDREVVIHSWDNVMPDGGGMRSVTAGVQLDVGFHTFELSYYEWDGTALLHFDTNIEPLGFEQTARLLNDALAENAILAAALEATQQLLEESEE
jgi:hypothetical protein